MDIIDAILGDIEKISPENYLDSETAFRVIKDIKHIIEEQNYNFNDY